MSENPLNISFNRGNIYIYLLNIAKNLRLFAPQTTIESSWAHHVHCARGDGSARGYCRLQVATCRSKSRQYPHISPYISTKSPKISTRFSEKPSHPRHYVCSGYTTFACYGNIERRYVRRKKKMKIRKIQNTRCRPRKVPGACTVVHWVLVHAQGRHAVPQSTQTPRRQQARAQTG